MQKLLNQTDHLEAFTQNALQASFTKRIAMNWAELILPCDLLSPVLES